MIGYIGNIEEITQTNTNFRQVLYTGTKAQLVVMNIEIGEDIGMETHEKVDQFFRVESGTAIVTMNGEENTVSSGMAFIVPAGVEHNIANASNFPLKLYTIYSPPNHPANTVHKTKSEAMMAE